MVLTWTSYAMRPLTVRELQYSIAIEPGTKEIDEEALCVEELLVSVCGGLVILDRESNFNRLVHYTTQEYFDRNRQALFPEGQKIMAVTCLTYLSFDNFQPGCSIKNGEAITQLFCDPFLRYAALCWGAHARHTNMHEIEDLVLGFLDDRPSLSYVQQNVDPWQSTSFSIGLTNSIIGLWVAATFGLVAVIPLLIARNIDINTQSPLRTTALYMAAKSGILSAVQLLLDHGADTTVMNPLVKVGALEYAVLHGYVEIMKLLLSHGADVNSQNILGTTALHVAVENDRQDMLKILLDHGAVVNARNMWTDTALHLAACRDYMDILRILLDHEADINAQKGNGFTALYSAVYNSRWDILKILLDRGADINAPIWERKPARRRSRRKDLQTAQMLDENAVEVKARNNMGIIVPHRYFDSTIVKILSNDKVMSIVHSNETVGALPQHMTGWGKVDTVKLLVAFELDKINTNDRVEFWQKSKAEISKLLLQTQSNAGAPGNRARKQIYGQLMDLINQRILTPAFDGDIKCVDFLHVVHRERHEEIARLIFYNEAGTFAQDDKWCIKAKDYSPETRRYLMAFKRIYDLAMYSRVIITFQAASMSEPKVTGPEVLEEEVSREVSCDYTTCPNLGDQQPVFACGPYA